MSSEASQGSEPAPEAIDSKWIAETLAEQVFSSKLGPSATLGRPDSLTSASVLVGVAELTTSLPSIELLRDDEPLDPRSPHLQVRGLLGQGGMGIVELAYQPLLNREVAVKRLTESSSTRAALLLREARVMGSLEHPNIIPIHTIGYHEKLGPLVVMKRIIGESWKERLATDQAQILGDEDLLAAHVEILVRVCQTIEFAHSRGVIHRDIKPSNVMLGEYNELYVVDWGLALESGRQLPPKLVGSPAYMAPEMVIGDSAQIGEYSDVYLLGATLHEILAGEHRHAASTIPAALARASASEPATYAPAVPAELAKICNRACHREPERRYATVEALRRALQQYLEYRRATAMLRAAATQHERLKALLASSIEGGSEAELNSCYQGVTTRYEQALEIWGELEAARAGRVQAMHDMLDYELDHANLPGAQRIMDELGEVPPEARARLEQQLDSQQSVVARLSMLEEEIDMQKAGPARRDLIGGVITAMVVLNLGLFAANPTLVVGTPPGRLIMIILALLAVAGLVLVLRWRELTANLAGRLYLRLLMGSLCGVLLNRVCGYFLGSSPLMIVTTDLLVVGMLMCVVRLPLSGTIFIGLGTIAAALSMVALPGYARPIFLATTSAIPMMLLVLDRLDRRSPAPGRS